MVGGHGGLQPWQNSRYEVNAWERAVGCRRPSEVKTQPA